MRRRAWPPALSPHSKCWTLSGFTRFLSISDSGKILDLKLDPCHAKEFTKNSFLSYLPLIIPDAGAPSGHGGGKPGKAPAARNKTRGAAGGGHGFSSHPGSSSGYDNRRNKNNHQKRFPAAKGGGGRGQQSYNTHHHQSPQQRGHVAEADEFEVGSVFKAGSKKQNANHLLNFYTDRRGVGGNRGDGGGGRRGAASRRFSGKNAYSGHRYIKEQYLQAK